MESWMEENGEKLKSASQAASDMLRGALPTLVFILGYQTNY